MLDFPSSPANGQIFAAPNGATYIYQSPPGQWTSISVPSSGGGGGSGTVTTVSVTSANGLAGTVANPTTTPAISFSTTVSGVLKGNGTAISAATAGTDYVTPGGLPASLPPSGAAGGDLAGTYPNPTIKPSVTNGDVLTTVSGVAAWAAAGGGGAPSGAAGGDLAGTYPNPTLKASVALTGNPTAPTATAGDSDTSIATTAFVANAVASIGVGGMSTAEYNYSTTLGPTPSTGQLRGDSLTQSAITNFYLHETNAVGVDITNALKIIAGGVKILVQDKTNAANVQYYTTSGPAVDNGVYFTIPVTWTSTGSGTAFTAGRVIFAGFGIGSNNMVEAPTDGATYGRRGSDASWQAVALLASPSFTGNPLAPTPTAGDNDTSIATTAFVTGAITTAATAYQPTDADLTALAALSTTGMMARTAANTYTMRTVTGTASRLSVTNGDGIAGNPTLNIDTAYAGQNTITTLGTITTGTWTGSVIAPQYLDTSLIAQNAQTGNYTLVLADAGKHIYHAVAAAAATYTIPANSSVAYPIGTTVTMVNDSANAVTIAITTDTLVLSPGTTTGSRTLATGGVATALKVTSTRWVINGSGLS